MLLFWYFFSWVRKVLLFIFSVFMYRMLNFFFSLALSLFSYFFWLFFDFNEFCFCRFIIFVKGSLLEFIFFVRFDVLIKEFRVMNFVFFSFVLWVTFVLVFELEFFGFLFIGGLVDFIGFGGRELVFVIFLVVVGLFMIVVFCIGLFGLFLVVFNLILLFFLFIGWFLFWVGILFWVFWVEVILLGFIYNFFGFFLIEFKFLGKLKFNLFLVFMEIVFCCRFEDKFFNWVRMELEVGWLRLVWIGELVVLNEELKFCLSRFGFRRWLRFKIFNKVFEWGLFLDDILGVGVRELWFGFVIVSVFFRFWFLGWFSNFESWGVDCLDFCWSLVFIN